MAIPVNIEALLGGGIIESERIEYKETWNAAASLKTICAFANDIDNWGGGYIVLGVHENADGTKSAEGLPLECIDRVLKDILNKCKLIRPDYMPIADVATFQEKSFVVLWCPGGSVRPYSCPKTIGKGMRERISYIRKMASTIEPSNTDLRELYNLSNNVPFDDRPNHEASINDLDKQLIRTFLKRIDSDLYNEMDSMSFDELCRAMDIATGPSEYLKPKNVGLMFFSPQPDRFFPCAQIDVVEFPDGLGGQRIIEHTFDGPLDYQLTQALRYLKGIVIEELVVKHEDRAEADRFFNYPYGALEEVLSNAVYHKGYDVREPIEVRVLPDRIEVLIHPGADRSISIEGLKTYRAISRRYRNRRVGDFLKELHLTEGRNTGMAKILHAMRANGSPDPVFETDVERLYFLVTLPIHPRFLSDSEHVVEPKASAHGTKRIVRTDENRMKLGNLDLEVKTYEMRPTEMDVLSFLLEHPHATVPQVSSALDTSTATVNRRIAALKRSGALVRVGNARSGHWEAGN